MLPLHHPSRKEVEKQTQVRHGLRQRLARGSPQLPSERRMPLMSRPTASGRGRDGAHSKRAQSQRWMNNSLFFLVVLLFSMAIILAWSKLGGGIGPRTGRQAFLQLQREGLHGRAPRRRRYGIRQPNVHGHTHQTNRRGDGIAGEDMPRDQKYGLGQHEPNLYGKKDAAQVNVETTTCSDGIKVPLNDNYCDCDDGLDEPKTSACSQLLVQQKTFKCRGSEVLIFSSRIKDGVVDCHDGSDEW